jgi:hypothetical protein
MANFAYTEAKHGILNGDIDLTGDDIRVLLVASGSTCGTEEDVTTISGFTTLSELSGTGYVRKALANEIVNKDNANDRAEFDADDVVWSAINAGTAIAALIYKHVTGDADSIPLFYIDSNFPFVTNGGDFTLQWNAEGIAQL